MFSSENMTFWTWKNDFGQTLSESETSQVDSSHNPPKKKFRCTTEKLKITHNTYNPKTVLQDQLMKKIAKINVKRTLSLEQRVCHCIVLEPLLLLPSGVWWQLPATSDSKMSQAASDHQSLLQSAVDSLQVLNMTPAEQTCCGKARYQRWNNR